MKKTLIIVILLFQWLYSLAENDKSPQSEANSFKYFSYNEEEINAEFEELSELEESLFEEIKYNPLYVLNSPEVNQFDFDFSSNFNYSNSIDDAAFLVGCCLGPVGLVIILASEPEENEVLQAVGGCIIPSAMFALGIYYKDMFLIEAALDLASMIFE